MPQQQPLRGVLVLTPWHELYSRLVPDNDGDGDAHLSMLCDAIGASSVDVLRLGPGMDLWLDGDGMASDEPVVNWSATHIARLNGFSDVYVPGTVVLAGVDNDTGELLPLDAYASAAIRQWVHEAARGHIAG